MSSCIIDHRVAGSIPFLAVDRLEVWRSQGDSIVYLTRSADLAAGVVVLEQETPLLAVGLTTYGYDALGRLASHTVRHF